MIDRKMKKESINIPNQSKKAKLSETGINKKKKA